MKGQNNSNDHSTVAESAVGAFLDCRHELAGTVQLCVASDTLLFTGFSDFSIVTVTIILGITIFSVTITPKETHIL